MLVNLPNINGPWKNRTMPSKSNDWKLRRLGHILKYTRHVICKPEMAINWPQLADILAQICHWVIQLRISYTSVDRPLSTYLLFIAKILMFLLWLIIIVITSLYLFKIFLIQHCISYCWQLPDDCFVRSMKLRVAVKSTWNSLYPCTCSNYHGSDQTIGHQ